jgi:hypothetical protein
MYAGVVVPNPRNSFPWWLLISVQSQVMTTSGIEYVPPFKPGQGLPGFRSSRDHEVPLIKDSEANAAKTTRRVGVRERTPGGEPVRMTTPDAPAFRSLPQWSGELSGRRPKRRTRTTTLGRD